MPRHRIPGPGRRAQRLHHEERSAPNVVYGAQIPAPPALPLDDEEDLLEALRAENEDLRIRVSQLDAATHEYRRQMAEVLTSVSWRVTAPLRGIAGKVRLARRRYGICPSGSPAGAGSRDPDSGAVPAGRVR